MTPEQLAAIKARAEKATPGPWVFYFATGEYASIRIAKSLAPIGDNLCDMEFIAHARQDVPALIAHIEHLEELSKKNGVFGQPVSDSECNIAAEKVLTEHADTFKKLAEVERLNKIIAKELTENDELGCEYTYVNALREELQTQVEVFTKMVNDREAEAERLRKEIINTTSGPMLKQAQTIEQQDAYIARLEARLKGLLADEYQASVRIRNYSEEKEQAYVNAEMAKLREGK